MRNDQQSWDERRDCAEKDICKHLGPGEPFVVATWDLGQRVRLRISASNVELHSIICALTAELCNRAARGQTP